ncbi:hypothetical protein LUZ60_008929 [Juncus effusus]|nr:hypothetical protein LUZ60_008929 [Juncus effusus]
MDFFTYNPKLFLLFISLQTLSFFTGSVLGTFDEGIDVIWGASDLVNIYNNGTMMTLSLGTISGAGFQTKDAYLFGRIDMEIKLVPGNSAGTVSTYYIASAGEFHDEVDFEFLGNVSGQPYVLHTNLFAHGVGDREQQFYLWFDPTADFHTYTFLWNPHHLAFLVDDVPIRDFQNHEDHGLFYPNSQPMTVHGSIWDGDGWATRGGQDKTDWSLAPFTVTYQNFNPQACVPSKSSFVCNLPADSDSNWLDQTLDENQLQKLRWVRKNFMIYNYCTDEKRWPEGFPPECALDSYC